MDVDYSNITYCYAGELDDALAYKRPYSDLPVFEPQRQQSTKGLPRPPKDIIEVAVLTALGYPDDNTDHIDTESPIEIEAPVWQGVDTYGRYLFVSYSSYGIYFSIKPLPSGWYDYECDGHHARISLELMRQEIGPFIANNNYKKSS